MTPALSNPCLIPFLIGVTGHRDLRPQDKLAEIVRVIESDESRRFAGEIETLNGYLKPISYDSRVSALLRKGFVGRAWLFDAIDQWRKALCANMTETSCVTAISEGGKENQHGNDERFFPTHDRCDGSI